MKYRDNMTPAERQALLDECNALDALYAAALDEALNFQPMPDEYEDEMETLRRAALNRGQP